MAVGTYKKGKKRKKRLKRVLIVTDERLIKTDRIRMGVSSVFRHTRIRHRSRRRVGHGSRDYDCLSSPKCAEAEGTEEVRSIKIGHPSWFCFFLIGWLT